MTYQPIIQQHTHMDTDQKKFLIKTEKSYLSIQPLPSTIDIPTIISEIDPHLVVNPKMMRAGKEVTQNRSLAFFSDESVGYKYSTYFAKSIPLTENTKTLLSAISELFNTKFNGILVNKYISGEDYIGKHSDDEKNLSDVGVVAISYGAVRKFRIREKVEWNKSGKIIKDIPTDSGMIMHMGGNFQKEFTHEIPVEKKVKGVRYSFTFRHHKK